MVTEVALATVITTITSITLISDHFVTSALQYNIQYNTEISVSRSVSNNYKNTDSTIVNSHQIFNLVSFDLAKSFSSIMWHVAKGVLLFCMFVAAFVSCFWSSVLGILSVVILLGCSVYRIEPRCSAAAKFFGAVLRHWCFWLLVCSATATWSCFGYLVRICSVTASRTRMWARASLGWIIVCYYFVLLDRLQLYLKPHTEGYELHIRAAYTNH
jgi:hypothetical protein